MYETLTDRLTSLHPGVCIGFKPFFFFLANFLSSLTYSQGNASKILLHMSSKHKMKPEIYNPLLLLDYLLCIPKNNDSIRDL